MPGTEMLHRLHAFANRNALHIDIDHGPGLFAWRLAITDKTASVVYESACERVDQVPALVEQAWDEVVFAEAL